MASLLGIGQKLARSGEERGRREGGGLGRMVYIYIYIDYRPKSTSPLLSVSMMTVYDPPLNAGLKIHDPSLQQLFIFG